MSRQGKALGPSNSIIVEKFIANLAFSSGLREFIESPNLAKSSSLFKFTSIPLVSSQMFVLYISFLNHSYF